MLKLTKFNLVCTILFNSWVVVRLNCTSVKMLYLLLYLQHLKHQVQQCVSNEHLLHNIITDIQCHVNDLTASFGVVHSNLPLVSRPTSDAFPPTGRMVAIVSTSLGTKVAKGS